jgi:TPP-dependent pyruvate/acetoin dehydrogenase alpha subunit
LAAIWKLPVIFLCENNGYAICTAQAETTPIIDIAVRASAYGILGTIVDGQDVLAVYHIVSDAVSRARGGEGPTLVEAKTYRFCDHQEDVKFPKYRLEEEVRAWQTKDPIEIFVGQLKHSAEWADEEIQAVYKQVQDEIAQAVAFAEQSPDPESQELLEDLYA